MRGMVNVGGKILRDYSLFELGGLDYKTNSEWIPVDRDKYSYEGKFHQNYFLFVPRDKYLALGDYKVKVARFNPKTGVVEYSHDIEHTDRILKDIKVSSRYFKVDKHIISIVDETKETLITHNLETKETRLFTSKDFKFSDSYYHFYLGKNLVRVLLNRQSNYIEYTIKLNDNDKTVLNSRLNANSSHSYTAGLYEYENRIYLTSHNNDINSPKLYASTSFIMQGDTIVKDRNTNAVVPFVGEWVNKYKGLSIRKDRHGENWYYFDYKSNKSLASFPTVQLAPAYSDYYFTEDYATSVSVEEGVKLLSVRKDKIYDFKFPRKPYNFGDIVYDYDRDTFVYINRGENQIKYRKYYMKHTEVEV